MTHDFQDGKGPVPAHQHTNPDGSTGGIVADTAQISGNAQISGDAQAKTIDNSKAVHFFKTCRSIILKLVKQHTKKG